MPLNPKRLESIYVAWFYKNRLLSYLAIGGRKWGKNRTKRTIYLVRYLMAYRH
jgi:hypothetical protein